MKIAIDASCLLINRYSGLSEVVHNLLLHLPHIDTDNEFTLFINYFRNSIMTDDIAYPGTTNNFCGVPRRLMVLWWKFGWPSIDFCLTQTDICHSLHIQIPPTKMIKTILTIHDCRFLALPNLYSHQEVEKYKNQMAISQEMSAQDQESNDNRDKPWQHFHKSFAALTIYTVRSLLRKLGEHPF